MMSSLKLNGVTYLVKNRFFLLRYLLPFRSVVYILIFKDYFIMKCHHV